MTPYGLAEWFHEPRSNRMNDTEMNELADLFEVLEHERKQHRLGHVLVKFLPQQ